jgi:hypothetical protein
MNGDISENQAGKIVCKPCLPLATGTLCRRLDNTAVHHLAGVLCCRRDCVTVRLLGCNGCCFCLGSNGVCLIGGILEDLLLLRVKLAGERGVELRLRDLKI